MVFDPEIITQAIISLVVITTPFDPVKILFFNQAIADPPCNRTISALRVMLYVALIIGGTAVIGRQILHLLDINLDAFRTVGGLMIAAMGFEMLYGGGGTHPQGEKRRKNGPDEEDTLAIPLTLPLIAGPGAIATTIAISSQGTQHEGLIAALIGGGIVAVITFVSFAWLGKRAAKIKASSMALFARLGGLLLATIGVQMLLSGLKNFFA
ncbi:MAG: MarC family protein [Verrucomicrobia bacterium]|nr:MarC family protein [Verrucomicrobiota bacterium]